jgi:hypothetical protein
MKTNSKTNTIESISTLDDGSIVIKFQSPHNIEVKKEDSVDIANTSDDQEFDMERDGIRPKAAALYCNVTVQTLINWRRDKIINAYGIGKRPVFYSKPELKKAVKIKQLAKKL